MCGDTPFNTQVKAMKTMAQHTSKANATECSRWRRIICLGSLIWIGISPLAFGGQYRNSAHGDGVKGVNRSAIDTKYQGYATGNCAHCHELHASIDGVEPSPQGGAASHALFAASFNVARTIKPYIETDDFCFFCHSSTSGQRVTNQDYSTSFGGATTGTGPQAIMEAFNQASYHNLYDIWNFLRNKPAFPGFTDTSNPCSGCHNSHLARPNWDSSKAGFPLLSAISTPTNRNRLWGEIELMSSHIFYESPFAFATSREPAGVGDADGNSTPDYVTFCATCHNESNTVWSTTLNRNLKNINWRATGLKRDKHGALGRDGTSSFREPYLASVPFKSNFVLSCLDCHESHGSENIMLLRRRINGENLENAIISTSAMGQACKRCHKDDLAAGAGTNTANRWEYVHHLAPGAPYSQMNCSNCHGMGGMGGEPIPCGNCHGHGMTDSWAGTQQTGRITF